MSVTTDERVAAQAVARPPSLRGKVAAGLMALGLVAGGGIALMHTGSSTSPASTAAGGPGGPGGPGGFGGGSFTPPTTGTVQSVTATTVTVKTATGTSTYDVTASTVIENNGSTAAPSALTAGEQVVVFTGAAPGSTATVPATTANRILAGTSAAGPGPGGPPA